MHYDTPEVLIGQLRKDLLEARKMRDQLASSALQALIAAIDNASAVAIPKTIISTEVPRRELSLHDIQEIIKNEILEMRQAIKKMGSQKNVYVDELREKIAVLEKYI